jgi:hypothetical protein
LKKDFYLRIFLHHYCMSLFTKYHFLQDERQTCYICSLKFQTEWGWRLKLQLHFSYSFVLFIIMNCIVFIAIVLTL